MSLAANYIEANEAVSRRDFSLRIKICRKEAKESRLWLRLCDVGSDDGLRSEQDLLIRESTELTRKFGAIVEKSKIRKAQTLSTTFLRKSKLEGQHTRHIS